MQSSAPAAAPTRVEPRLSEFKRQLAEGRAALEAAYRVRPNPPALLKRQAALVDRVLREVWAEAAMPPSLALVAVGGYGRGTLFPYSDVDVLILLPEEMDEGDREQVSHLVSRLWDIGVELGHSVRTIEQCLSEAKQDITV